MFNNFKKLTKILHLNERKFDATGFVSFDQEQGQYYKTFSYYKNFEQLKSLYIREEKITFCKIFCNYRNFQNYNV